MQFLFSFVSYVLYPASLQAPYGGLPHPSVHIKIMAVPAAVVHLILDNTVSHILAQLSESSIE